MSRGRIMIVEDESLVAEDLDMCLTRAGYEVVGVADTFDSAKVIAEVARPDLALLDIRLKGLGDGIDLAAELRQRDIGFVFLTSHSDESTLARAEITEPLGYILKPFSPSEMIPVLRTAMYRHSGELRLRNLEQWLRMTLQSIGDAVFVTDESTCLTYANPIGERLLQRPLRKLVGWPLRELLRIVTPGSSTPQECVASRAIRSGETVYLGLDCELLRSDGSRLPIDDCASPIRDQSGRITGVVVIMRDATERRVVEQQRLEAERRMRDAERLQSLGALASGLAHDLNNVLTSILGNATLCRDLLPADARDPVDQIEANARAAAQLCRRMLEGAGAVPVHLCPVDLAAVIGACVARERALAADIRFVQDAGGGTEGDAMVQADELQSMQVVQNLLRNAVEAMAGRRGEIRLRWRQIVVPGPEAPRSATLPPGAYVRLDVADDGPGVPADVQARIFEPFFTTKFTGRGLGLASVHGILHRHSGAIEVESPAGEGATFHVFWPAAVGTRPSPPAPSPVQSAARVAGVALVVDDDESVRLVACRLLRHHGWACHEAASGEAALELLADGLAIDGVVLDIMMPGMNGIDVLARIRESRATLPVLLVSGAVGVGTVPAHDPHVDFLQKPYSLDAMLQKVTRWLAVS